MHAVGDIVLYTFSNDDGEKEGLLVEIDGDWGTIWRRASNGEPVLTCMKLENIRKIDA